MVSVQAFSRLHFGLFNLGGGGFAEADAPRETATQRRYGGVGLMIERPGVKVRLLASSSWSAAGPLAERALSFAHRFTRATQLEESDDDLPPRRLIIEQAAPEHSGLGTGTQLGLAVAQALAVSWERPCDLRSSARRVARGLRSALGAHGFEQGGFLLEAGKRRADELAPLVARLPFPKPWRLVLVVPTADTRNAGLYGSSEVKAFEELAARSAAPDRSDALCRLVLLGLLPALVEGDVNAFGEALHEFNTRVGEAFAPVQGGVYASPRVAEFVAFARDQGVRGAGQSSWGPTAFAVVGDEDQAEYMAKRLRDHFALEESAVIVTQACNHGALLELEHRS